MKKILAFFVALVVAQTLLAGPGQGKGQNKGEDKDKSAKKTEQVQADNKHQNDSAVTGKDKKTDKTQKEKSEAKEEKVKPEQVSTDTTEAKGNAYGKNKEGLTGKEFGNNEMILISLLIE